VLAINAWIAIIDNPIAQTSAIAGVGCNPVRDEAVLSLLVRNLGSAYICRKGVLKFILSRRGMAGRD
jgi:hypothetical protein